MMRYRRIITRALFIFFGLTMVISCNREKKMKMNDPHNIKSIGNYQHTFGDLNDLHLETAKRIGILPLSLRDALDAKRDGLVELESNEYYHIDSLTHSIPFLVPVAANLLDTIGSNFLDSLKAKGLNPYNIVVTSVLRTHSDIRKLRRNNSNASLNSAHTYGTTFDIAYTRYHKVEDPDGYPTQDVNKDTLKLVLGEVMRDLRQDGKCYVKYEVKQGCFHVTAR